MRDYDDDDFGFDGEGYTRRRMFADPGGKSALRAASRSNPRNLPCPSCHAPDVLTPADQAQGYQCDRCADAAERGIDRDLVCSQDAECSLCARLIEEAEEDGEERAADDEAERNACPTCGTTQGQHARSCENRPDDDDPSPRRRCPDCGARGELAGHMECPYPRNREEG